jgi:hypothetical protein
VAPSPTYHRASHAPLRLRSIALAATSSAARKNAQRMPRVAHVHRRPECRELLLVSDPIRPVMESQEQRNHARGASRAPLVQTR